MIFLRRYSNNSSIIYDLATEVFEKITDKYDDLYSKTN